MQRGTCKDEIAETSKLGIGKTDEM
jgi:hypothetical protein